MNIANVLEMQGYDMDSRGTFSAALERAVGNDLPTYYIRIRAATVLPRILPASESELFALRHRLESDLDELLSSSARVSSDNAPPVNYGFSLGNFLAFHGASNVALKSKLHRVYLRFCPALGTGVYVTRDMIGNAAKPAIEAMHIHEDMEVEQGWRREGGGGGGAGTMNVELK
eukprot:gene22122-28169_t